MNRRMDGADVFSDWIMKTKDDQQKAFLRDVLHAEVKANEDLRGAFQTIWTPKARQTTTATVS